MRSVSPLGFLAFGALVIVGCSTVDPVAGPATRDITPASTAPDDTSTGASVTEPSRTATTGASDPLEYSIEWESVDDRTDGGWLTVPLDYDDPDGATTRLWVMRHKADPDKRIGTLFVNNGGPGAPASSMARDATAWFDSQLVDAFDIVAWDPRGTGQSDSSVDCIADEDYDRFFGAPDITPDDDAERDELVDLAEEFAADCIAAVGADVLSQIGTNNTARDMDAIRQALGESQASFFGFSYGSELGATWATLFPDTVRAAVLDGASDPAADEIEQTRQQWIGFEHALNTFLAQCSADSGCAFHSDGDAEGAFDSLLQQLDESPIPSADGRTPVNLAVAQTAVVQAMYSDAYWPALERALDDARNGDGAGLLQLYDAYYRSGADGGYSNLLESFQAISCADEPARLTPDEADAAADDLIGVAPRLFPSTTGSYACSFFPESDDPRIEVTGAGAGPIVVVGTTGDPSTPLDSSRKMAAALEDGRLVVVTANQHTGYGVNACIDDVIHRYLVTLEAPADETQC